AHDDYRISIPIAELLRYDVLLALKMDGAPLTARTKGPIWMMYPQDAHEELQNDATNLKMVWYVRRLTVQ
ncbi:MAG: molybdopterin-dependent oxidoreductase, partial [Pseudomonadota bacterium]